MSLFGTERIGCPEVLASLVFIIEDAIEQVERPEEVRNHIDLCPNCSRQLEHEQLTHTFLVDALRRSCTEKAPSSLYESIHNQLVSAQANTEVVTTFSMTEISIEIDEFGNVEHREIQIEQTHVQHINFDDGLPGGKI
jgi:anti-sigma factor (TIGR02949 family)